MKLRNCNLSLASVFLILTGCMMGPDFHTPKAPETSSYTEAPAVTKTSSVNQRSGASQVFVMQQRIPNDWWQLFHSPEINQLIKMGIANNPNLAAAKSTLTLAQENVNAAVGNDFFPAVNANLSGQRETITGTSFGSHTASLFSLYNASINVSYTLDFFGAERRQVEALRAQVDYGRYEMNAALLSLTGNIVTSSITLASFQEQINATKKIIALEENQLEILKKQFALGGASRTDVLTQETTVAQTKASLPPLEQSLAQTQHALSVLVGVLPSEFQTPHLTLASLQLPTTIPVSLPSHLVEQRPDIKAAEALLHVANAEVGVATANLYPQINLTGSFGREATSPSALFNPVNKIWNIGGSLLQPVFQGGALTAEKRAAEAASNVALAQYRQVVLQAFQNVADALRALEHDANTLKQNVIAASSARTNLQLTQSQYKLGAVNYITLLTAQRLYQQTLINRIQAEAARYTDTAALFQALGGGWWYNDNEATV